jgi:predicted HTH domain antitoxin
LVIFDEAHKLKAYKYGDKIERTDRYKTAAVLTNYDCCDNVLLLTATPHDGNPYPFFSLLQLIDPYIAQDEYSLIPERTDQIIIRRLKEDAKKWDGTPLFKKRYVESIPLEYDEKGPEYKLRKAIRKYTDGSVSLGKASEIAGMPKRLFMYKLQEIGIPLNVSESDFMKVIDTLIKAKKLKKSS